MSIDLTVRDGIAEIVLNRPEALNAIDPDMRAELGRTWARVHEDDEIRVALDISERSIDFTGGWDVWWRRVSQSYLTDNAGRRYAPELPEARGGNAGQAEPGSSRRGRAVFYAPRTSGRATRLTLHYPIGGDASRMLSIPIPINE